MTPAEIAAKIAETSKQAQQGVNVLRKDSESVQKKFQGERPGPLRESILGTMICTFSLFESSYLKINSINPFTSVRSPGRSK